MRCNRKKLMKPDGLSWTPKLIVARILLWPSGSRYWQTDSVLSMEQERKLALGGNAGWTIGL